MVTAVSLVLTVGVLVDSALLLCQMLPLGALCRSLGGTRHVFCLVS